MRHTHSLSPGLRKTMSAEQYGARINTSGFRAVQIEQVDCKAEVCKVGFKLTYDYIAEKGLTAAKGITTMASETWVVEAGSGMVRHAAIVRAAVADFPQFCTGGSGRDPIRSTNVVARNNIPALLVLK